MNEDLRFDRNYLRRHIWPLIEKRWPGAAAALSRSARHAVDAQVSLDRAAAADVARLRDGDALSVTGLRSLKPEARMNAVRYWLGEAGAELPSTARLHEALRQMLDAQSDHLPVIEWGDWALRRYRQRMFLTSAELPAVQPAHWQLAGRGDLDLGATLGALRWVEQPGGLDPRRLPARLEVRRRVGGETLKMSAGSSTHTLQHLCQLHGVLPWMRDSLPLVHAGEVLIAVADLWTDSRWCNAPDQPGLALAWIDAPIIV